MYEVSWCIIGKEPEAEPFLFHSGYDAAKFLREEITWLVADLQGDELRQCQEAMLRLKDVEERPRSLVFTIGDISYWLSDLQAQAQGWDMRDLGEL